MIRMLAKLLQVLNSESEPGQLSLAFSFAMIAGLTPFVSLHNLFVLFLVLLLRVNLSAFILGSLFFTGAAYMLDPLFHQIGSALLHAEGLKEVWTTLYNNPYARLTRFNNSIMTGSLLFSLILFIPLYLISNLLIRKYRDHVLAVVRRSRIMQFFRATKFYQAYEKISSLKGVE